MKIFIIVLLSSMLKRWPIISAINGVATLNVVAVPASKANTAKRSIKRPANPSVCFPKSGRHASEYFCLLLFLTCSIKPKATANTR